MNIVGGARMFSGSAMDANISNVKFGSVAAVNVCVPMPVALNVKPLLKSRVLMIEVADGADSA